MRIILIYSRDFREKKSYFRSELSSKKLLQSHTNILCLTTLKIIFSLFFFLFNSLLEKKSKIIIVLFFIFCLEINEENVNFIDFMNKERERKRKKNDERIR